MEIEQEGTRLPDSYTAPWLVFPCCNKRKKKKSQAFFSISEERVYIREISEMKTHRYWPTPQGWMLLEQTTSRNWFLLNPTTMKKIELPPLKWSLPNNSTCLLSASPDKANFMVLCTDFQDRHLFLCHCEDMEGRKWTRHKYDCGEHNNIMSVVVHNGNFYTSISRSELAVIDFSPNVASIRSLVQIDSTPFDVGLWVYSPFLVESCGEMFIVICYWHAHKIVHIQMMKKKKKSSSIETWDIVHSIGDRVFFLSTYNGFSMSWSASKLKVKENCIYLTRKNNKHLYIFDIEEGTASVQLPCPNVISKRWSDPLWIVPPIKD